MTSTFVIKPDHPALPGHFPGAPVAPGVVVLDAMIAAAARLWPDRACTGVRRMKFLRPLAAGETVELAWGEPGAESVLVRARVGEELLVDGRLLLAPAAPDAGTSAG